MYDGNGKDDDDRELIERCHSGDRTALNEVYRLCAWPIIRFFHNKAKPEHVQDLCQETMTRLIERVCSLDPSRPILPYAFGIARYVLREHLRKQARLPDCDPESMALAVLMPNAVSIIAEAQEQKLLLQALREIPLEQQILFELHYFEGISIERIATDYLNIPSSTARNRIKKARELVKQRILSYEASPELIRSTVTRLDDWAARIREQAAKLRRRDDDQSAR